MVKFGKNKFKALNKLAKKQNDSPSSNKVMKKKLNAEKKVSFQKQVLLKQALKSEVLVKKEPNKVSPAKSKDAELQSRKEKQVKKKIKAVEKQKKRQKTQINDTKLLLSLMNKKKNT